MARDKGARAAEVPGNKPTDELTVAEAAAMIARTMPTGSFSEQRVRLLCANGRIKARKHGARPWVILRRDVQRYIDSGRLTPRHGGKAPAWSGTVRRIEVGTRAKGVAAATG
jgi:hypothetical protein